MSLHCPYCLTSNESSESRTLFVSFGSFIRSSDLTRQPRYRCKPCKKTFSKASFELCYRQKKRHLNSSIFECLVSGMSQRRLSRVLGTNRKTIVRKFIFLGVYSDLLLKKLRSGSISQEIEFDDLETFEHTKLKPLSVIMAVESKTRRILGFRVARMPAKGLLVDKSMKKYGKRTDERKYLRDQLFAELKERTSSKVFIKSDENPHYKSSVRSHFPESTHWVFKGQRGCVTGQGELKAVGFDPLFSLNHTFAMLRANINRLFRRTWNTTKKPERLALHISLYVLYHNLVLIKS